MLKAENYSAIYAHQLEIKKELERLKQERTKTDEVEALVFEMVSLLSTYVDEEKSDGFFSLAQRYIIKLREKLNDCQ